MNTPEPQNDTTKPESAKKTPPSPSVDAAPSSVPTSITGRALASSPLVVTLLIVLLAAVVIQGGALIGIYAGRDGDRSNLETTAATAPGVDNGEAPLVARTPGTSIPPKSAQPTPGGGVSALPFDADFFSDDWRPFAEMARMRERMDRLFEDSFSQFRAMPGFDEGWLDLGRAAGGDAAIREEDGAFVITIDLPGADESSIEVDLDGRTLTVSGEREEASERRDANGNVTKRSRSSSTFLRRFPLPGPVEVVGVSSAYSDGVLTITVPKKTA